MADPTPTATIRGRHMEERGRSSIVHADTTLPQDACQAIERDYSASTFDAHAGPRTPAWEACGLPPFARVYCEGTPDEHQPVLCWRHLCNLGDTEGLHVEPYGAIALREVTEQQNLGPTFVAKCGHGVLTKAHYMLRLRDRTRWCSGACEEIGR